MFSSCLNSQTTVGFTAIQVLNTPVYQKLVGSLIADCCQSYQGQITIEATLSDWNADCLETTLCWALRISSCKFLDRLIDWVAGWWWWWWWWWLWGWNVTLEQTDAWVPGSCSSKECQQLLLASFLIHKQIPVGLAGAILGFLLLVAEVVVVLQNLFLSSILLVFF